MADKSNLPADSILLARQPIVDAGLNLFAYELLYRPEALILAPLIGDQATRKVLVNSLTSTDLDNLVGDVLAFINMTRQTILEIEYLGIPTERVILEILEDIELDPELLEKIEELKVAGYRFALDDFTLDGIHTEHVPLAEIVKVDIQGMSDAVIIDHANTLKKDNVKLLAEKVETWREFELCKEAGFEYFQGYFYARPQIISGAQIQHFRSTTLTLIQKLQNPNSTASELEALILQDPGLSYKLFKYSNSAAYSRGREFSKIHEVIVLLGMDRLRGIVTLFTLSSMSDKPLIITEAVLRRAYLCSLIATETNQIDSNDYFTMGMFSMLDCYLNHPLDQLLNDLPLNEKIKAAILTREGFMGKTLRLAEKLESTSSTQFTRFMTGKHRYFELYQEATRLSREIITAISA